MSTTPVTPLDVVGHHLWEVLDVAELELGDDVVLAGDDVDGAHRVELTQLVATVT